MKIRKKNLLSRFEALQQRLNLDIFRHIIRDNTFGMEYNYLPIDSTRRQSSNKNKENPFSVG